MINYVALLSSCILCVCLSVWRHFQQRGTIITLPFPKLSSAYSYYGITGPKTSSATALPAHRAPPPLGKGFLYQNMTPVIQITYLHTFCIVRVGTVPHKFDKFVDINLTRSRTDHTLHRGIPVTRFSPKWVFFICSGLCKIMGHNSKNKYRLYLKNEIRSVEHGFYPMQLFSFLITWRSSSSKFGVQNLLLCAEFHRNRMIFGWDMAM